MTVAALPAAEATAARGATARGAAAGAAGAGFTLPKFGSGKKKHTGAHRLLIAEFLIVIITIGLSPLGRDDTDDDDHKAAGDWVRKASAACALWIVLGLIASVGPRSSKAAAGFGGLVALVLLIDQRSVWTKLAEVLDPTAAAARETGQEIASGVADVIGDSVPDVVGVPPATRALDRWRGRS